MGTDIDGWIEYRDFVVDTVLWHPAMKIGVVAEKHLDQHHTHLLRIHKHFVDRDAIRAILTGAKRRAIAPESSTARGQLQRVPDFSAVGWPLCLASQTTVAWGCCEMARV